MVEESLGNYLESSLEICSCSLTKKSDILRIIRTMIDLRHWVSTWIVHCTINYNSKNQNVHM